MRWFGDLFFGAFFAAGLLYLSVPSSLFVKPIELHFDEGTQKFRFTREVTPWIMVDRGEQGKGHVGRWWSEIVLIDARDFECQSGVARNAFYQQKPGNTVEYRLGAWAQECIDAGPPFYITTSRQIMLWGWLPLRPSTNASGIQGEREGATIIIVPMEE